MPHPVSSGLDLVPGESPVNFKSISDINKLVRGGEVSVLEAAELA